MADVPPAQSLIIHSQYVKDLSFENPHAPAIYGALGQQGPALNIVLDLRTQPLRERAYEVVLTLRAQANSEDKTAFLIELDYAGVVSLAATVAEENKEALLMIEAPRYLFPFARNVLATVTREGGFPPLLLNPIDFEQFYEHYKENKEKAAAAPQP